MTMIIWLTYRKTFDGNEKSLVNCVDQYWQSCSRRRKILTHYAYRYQTLRPFASFRWILYRFMHLISNLELYIHDILHLSVSFRWSFAAFSRKVALSHLVLTAFSSRRYSSATNRLRIMHLREEAVIGIQANTAKLHPSQIVYDTSEPATFSSNGSCILFSWPRFFRPRMLRRIILLTSWCMLRAHFGKKFVNYVLAHSQSRSEQLARRLPKHQATPKLQSSDRYSDCYEMSHWVALELPVSWGLL
jgi:hypothetical protein